MAVSNRSSVSCNLVRRAEQATVAKTKDAERHFHCQIGILPSTRLLSTFFRSLIVANLPVQPRSSLMADMERRLVVMIASDGNVNRMFLKWFP